MDGGEHLIGVLDGGGFGPADPALDLVAVWHLLNRKQRSTVQSRLESSEVECQTVPSRQEEYERLCADVRPDCRRQRVSTTDRAAGALCLVNHGRAIPAVIIAIAAN